MNEQEKLTIEFEINYELKFLGSSIAQIKNGEPCYVYSKKLLETFCKTLDKKNIQYDVEKKEDYWVINSKNRRK